LIHPAAALDLPDDTLVRVTVEPVATELGIELLFLPSYSPNLNLIERLWRFPSGRPCTGSTTRRSRTSRPPSRPYWAEPRRRTPTAWHADGLASLMTLQFQEVENVSPLAA
jgi:hypothetical protein